ncbi:hypothetical protein WJX73_003161 [Symbiochloris irregularis]|uniref:RRM domain-containing protein n=1 Tax=Symbiochloris irregularis TaxID=706552 RepID=A0AAW1PIN7_9CHLO
MYRSLKVGSASQAKKHGLDFAAIAAGMKSKPAVAAVAKFCRDNHAWLSAPVASRPGPEVVQGGTVLPRKQAKVVQGDAKPKCSRSVDAPAAAEPAAVPPPAKPMRTVLGLLPPLASKDAPSRPLGASHSMPPSSRGTEQPSLSQHLRSTLSGEGRLGGSIVPNFLSQAQPAAGTGQAAPSGSGTTSPGTASSPKGSTVHEGTREPELQRRLLSADAQLVLGLLPAQPRPPPKGDKLCIDFVGMGVSSAQLLRSLRTLDPNILSCKSVKQQLEADVGQSRAGWAVLTFRHHKDAVEACQKLRHIYWKTVTSPIPRPLLVHWPTKGLHMSDNPAVEVPGYIPDIQVPPHFAQPNSAEFVPATEWRHHLQSQAWAKRELHRQHAQELSDIMAQYVEEAQFTVRDESPPPAPLENGMARGESGEVKGSSFLWLKGVSKCALMEHQVFENAFEQWGVLEVQKLMDPVLGELSGHVLVRLREHEQVKRVNADLCEMVYLLGGTPRLVTSRVAQPGMPEQCRQDVYDAALRQVFKKDDHSKFAPRNLTLISLPRPGTWEELYAVRLRARLEHQALELAEVRSLGQQAERELHQKHQTHIDAEMYKLKELKRNLASPTMTQMLGTYNKTLNQSFEHFMRNLPKRYKRNNAMPLPLP